MPNTSLAEHCKETARRFLLTAVVVDDELSVSTDPPVQGDLVRPGRGAPNRARKAVASHPRSDRLLRVHPITWSFARQGMVCGVVSPQDAGNDDEALAKAVARADIVILDWRLGRNGDADALPLLKRILTDDRSHRLRLIAIYTGETDHDGIRDRITNCLGESDVRCRPAPAGDGHPRGVEFGACRIVVYAKPRTMLPERSAIIGEEELADRLIADFARMVEGILPRLVLTALAAVRENVFRVLECFDASLDPAFLTHRACLSQPVDSEQHIVELVASEMRGIMEDKVARQSPAGIELIEHWLQDRFADGKVAFGQGKEMSQREVRAMLEDGVEKQRGPLRKGGRDFRVLSGGFSGCPEDGRQLDLRLAAAMSLRQVLAGTERQLWMGTVVERIGNDPKTLLCVTPKCDSVRLADISSFLFLSLSKPKPKTPQIVVPAEGNEHRRMTISMEPSGWVMADFDPDPDRTCVLAHCNGADQEYTFKDACGTEYRWVGELKPEFAQSIAQALAERTSRIPLNKSEWLRRSEGSS